MDHVVFFKHFFESIPGYRKISFNSVYKSDVDPLTECGLLKNDIICLYISFTSILIEHNEEYLDCLKNEETSILQRLHNY